jgi:hypothetical protein
MVNQKNSAGENRAMTWELLKLSDSQLKLIADQMLFRLDSCDSCSYAAAASIDRIYELNNKLGKPAADDEVIGGMHANKFNTWIF